MATITYVCVDGVHHELVVPNGKTVKDGAVDNLVPGIAADCGGQCACATCHVHVNPDWWKRVGGPGDVEADLLEFADNLSDTSRLSCQIIVSDDLDGLVVTIPEGNG